MCQQGVRYLSRVEELHARNILNQRFNNDPQAQEDEIQISDQYLQDFVDAAHCAIDDWLAQGEV